MRMSIAHQPLELPRAEGPPDGPADRGRPVAVGVGAEGPQACGDINRSGSAPVVKRKPKNFRSSGRATALFDSLTLSRSFFVRNLQTPAITRSPARRLRT